MIDRMDSGANNPWDGDRQSRLQVTLTQLGFSSLNDFLVAHPGISYSKLAESLRDAAVAPMQIYGLQIRQATAAGQLREAAKDSLARFINEHIKRGWSNGRHFNFRRASALGDWISVVTQYSGGNRSLEARLSAVSEELKASSPPQSWKPVGGSDEIIRSAFERCWPPGGES